MMDSEMNESPSCLEETNEVEGQVMQENQETEHKGSTKAPGQENYEKMLASIEKSTTPEEKISHILMFMEESLAHGNAPAFKYFWEARKLSMDLFKEESLPYAVRSHLWNKYVEMTKEAHRLKEVLDEQSKFAAEQIDLAIQSLESEILQIEKIAEASSNITFDPPSQFLGPVEKKYLDRQKELNVLNAFAARINALRKELIKTEMRIRFKNKFFQSLSAAGDKVFPRRKELIKELSKEFIEDVERIIQENYTAEEPTKPVFLLRDEIKALQGIAKILTLNTQAFNTTRKNLSECWDKIKKYEKEKKKERAIVKSQFKENCDLVDAKIKEIEEKYAAKELDDNQVINALDDAAYFMRGVQLDRDDVRHFRNRLNKINDDIQDRVNAAEKEKRERAHQAEVERKERFDSGFKQLKNLVDTIEQHSIETVLSEKERLVAEIQALGPKKAEVTDLERLIRTLDDALSHKRIKNLPADDKAAYEELQSLLKQCKTRRREIRDQLEQYRKAAGSSGFDLEKAFKQQELEKHEKERLAQVDSEITSIETRLKGLGTNL